jgi:hypothetical protein
MATLMAAACSAEPDDGVSSADDHSTNEGETLEGFERDLAYSQCMRDNGIENFPDPVQHEDGAIELSLDGSIDNESEEFNEAERACEGLRPGSSGGEPIDPDLYEALVEFSECMRDNGISAFPDPQPDGGIMFDDIGPNHRQGTAIFIDSFISQAPAGDANAAAWVRRMRVYRACWDAPAVQVAAWLLGCCTVPITQVQGRGRRCSPRKRTCISASIHLIWCVRAKLPATTLPANRRRHSHRHIRSPMAPGNHWKFGNDQSMAWQAIRPGLRRDNGATPLGAESGSARSKDARQAD